MVLLQIYWYSKDRACFNLNLEHNVFFCNNNNKRRLHCNKYQGCCCRRKALFRKPPGLLLFWKKDAKYYFWMLFFLVHNQPVEFEKDVSSVNIGLSVIRPHADCLSVQHVGLFQSRLIFSDQICQVQEHIQVVWCYPCLVRLSWLGFRKKLLCLKVHQSHSTKSQSVN